MKMMLLIGMFILLLPTCNLPQTMLYTY